MNKNIIFNNIRIEYCSRNYDSSTVATAQSITSRLSTALWSGLAYLAGYNDNDQICFVRLNERAIEEVISTGITEEMLKKFSINELTDDSQVKEFLKNATDNALTQFDENQLQNICKLILSSPDKLDFIKPLYNHPK